MNSRRTPPARTTSLILTPVVGLTSVFGATAISLSASAADYSAREVTAAFYNAKDGVRVDYAGKDLRFLELSGINFKAARLTGSDLFGVDLTSANLTGVDLEGARLDRATVIRADFSGANLKRASFRRPTTFTGLAADWAEAPRFVGANLNGIKIIARLDGADFRGADLSGAVIGPHDAAWGATITAQPRTGLSGCNFAGARLVGTDLSHAVLQFAKFAGADLTGADLSGADLTQADFSGADLTNANVTGADFTEVKLAGVKGLDTAVGLGQAQNLDKAFR